MLQYRLVIGNRHTVTSLSVTYITGPGITNLCHWLRLLASPTVPKRIKIHAEDDLLGAIAFDFGPILHIEPTGHWTYVTEEQVNPEDGVIRRWLNRSE